MRYRNVQSVSGILLLIAATAILVLPKVTCHRAIFLRNHDHHQRCTRLMASFNQKRIGLPYITSLIISLLIIAAGIILVLNPFATWLLFFQIFGGILIFMGASDAVNHFQRKRA